MKFNDFIGNEKVKEKLSRLIESSRLPHAIVIEGEEGLGKKTLAREIALSLFCKGDEERPCRKCAQCSKVLKNIHPDIIHYYGSGISNTIAVGTIRELIEDAYIKPNEADYKILILDDCANMNASAQNALLKVLEEPPEYVVIILCVNSKSTLLETVLSRSVVITLEGVDSSQGAQYICAKDESISYEDAFKALSLWGGNIGKALECLNDGKLSKISEIANDIACAMIKDNEYELLKACSVFEKDRETLIASLSLLKAILRDALLYDSKVNSVSGQNETAKLLASRLTDMKLLKLIDVCDRVSYQASGNGNNAILITKICYELRRAQGR